MSSTLGDTRTRARFHLKDRNPSSQVFSTFEMNDAVYTAMMEVAAATRLGKEWSASAVSITNATDTYSLPTATYAQLLSIRLVSTKTQLDLITREQFERLRNADTSPSGSGAGVPQVYTAWENSNQALKIQLWPWPSAPDHLDVLVSTLPSAFTADTDSVPFDAYGCEAVALRAAGNLAASASADMLQRLGLGETAAQSFLARAARLERQSRVRAATVGQHAHSRRGRAY